LIILSNFGHLINMPDFRHLDHSRHYVDPDQQAGGKLISSVHMDGLINI
jgi:hypothetical protein